MFNWKKLNIPKQKLDWIVIPILVVIVSIIASTAASTGNIKLVGVLAIAVLGVGLFFNRVFLLWSTIALGLVVAGLARLYAPGLQQIRWLVIPIICGLLLYVVTDYLLSTRSKKSTATSPIVLWTVFFIVLTIISALVNLTDLKSMVIGLKGYFQVWGLLFAIAYIKWPEDTISKLPAIFLGVAVLQLPFVLHQYIFIVPQRVGLDDGIVAVDVVAGTFGADRFGGGMNAVLSTYLFVAFAGVLGLFREGIVSGFRLLVLTLILLFPVFVNSAKISVFYFLAIVVILYSREIIQRPLKFIGISIAAIALLGALLASFIKHSPSSDVSSVSELIEFTYQYNVGAEETFDGKLSRGGSMIYWVEHHGLQDVFGTVLGHGVGASRVESESADTIMNNIDPDLGLGRIAVVAVLWESGLLGLICVFGIFASAYSSAGRLEKFYHDTPWHVGVFAGIKAGIGVIFVSLWHKNFLVYQIGYQTMLVLILGYLVYWERMAKNSPPEQTKESQPEETSQALTL